MSGKDHLRRETNNSRAFIEILNYCFLTPSPQSKAVTLLPSVARLMMDVSEPCLLAGISILSAERQVAELTRSVWRHPELQ